MEAAPQIEPAPAAASRLVESPAARLRLPVQDNPRADVPVTEASHANRPGAYLLGPGHTWTQAAESWPVRLVRRQTEPGHLYVEAQRLDRNDEPAWQDHLVCEKCGQSVTCLRPAEDREGYVLSTGEISRNVLIHIRHCHEQEIDDVP